MTRAYKYCASTIEEATALIRNSLGADAMIVSTDRLKGEDGRIFFEICAVPGDKRVRQQGRVPQVKSSSAESTAFDQIQQELRTIKEMMGVMKTAHAPMEGLMKNPAAMGLYVRMMNQGIEERLINDILTKADILTGDDMLTTTQVKKRVATALMGMLDVADPFACRDKKQVVAAFVGTTGVGKTTTIAKIAARLMVERQRSVGLISIDTYRIGAMEQLKNYADILGIPCFQAFTPSDLLLALGRLRSRDVVLVDTAGRSQYDMARLDGLKKMIGEHAAIDTHLLLSVGHTPAELKQTVSSFRPLNFKTYIFTKLDEARMMGNIINQTAACNVPISYITSGQNVPEDIEQANKRKLLTLLLGKQEQNCMTAFYQRENFDNGSGH